MGVAACLMAPLTCYRSFFERQHAAARQFVDADDRLAGHGRVDAAGADAAAASGAGAGCSWRWPRCWSWRLLLIACGRAARRRRRPLAGPQGSYRVIMRHPAFVAMAPLAFFSYGGLIAMQSLWAGPWLTQVVGLVGRPGRAGLFVINLCMLFAFLAWGALMPRLVKAGISARRLIGWGLPSSMLMLAPDRRVGAGRWRLPAGRCGVCCAPASR